MPFPSGVSGYPEFCRISSLVCFTAQYLTLNCGKVAANTDVLFGGAVRGCVCVRNSNCKTDCVDSLCQLAPKMNGFPRRILGFAKDNWYYQTASGSKVMATRCDCAFLAEGLLLASTGLRQSRGEGGGARRGKHQVPKQSVNKVWDSCDLALTGRRA